MRKKKESELNSRSLKKDATAVPTARRIPKWYDTVRKVMHTLRKNPPPYTP